MKARRRECATLGRSDVGPMRMRLLATVLIVTLGLTASAASSTRKTDPPGVRGQPTFFISGHGWGHGLGLSQYGAYGYAQHGWKYDRILKHYYTGTTIGQAPLKRIRVLVAEGVKLAAISSKLPFQVVDASGARFPLDAGSYSVGAAFKAADPDKPSAKSQALQYPLEFRPGATALALGGRGYRGTLRVLKTPRGKLNVVNVLDLDLYLRGVVPSEMPRDWAAEALKAQAVAARSYALSHLHTGGGFDVYADTRDQVYLGIPHEATTTTAAVNSTAGQVVLYKGKVASTYFFSTSGGRTASVQDVYPGSAPIPYLVSVADPYDSISPYHDWGPYRFSAAKLARKLKVPGKLLDVHTDAASSGRVRSLVLTGSNGEATVSGGAVRTAMGLRSTWFQLGMLALAPPTVPVTYGSVTALAGTARGVAKVVLQQRAGDGDWQDVATLKPRGGAIAPKIKPDSSSKFRLAYGEITSDAVAVFVAAAVRLRVAYDLSGYRGTVKPAAAGAAVTIQRQVGPGWRPVGRATTTAAGRFTLSRSVEPGTYRARVAAKGLAPGFSRPVTAG
jgi:stage II sporulation protein D